MNCDKETQFPVPPVKPLHDRPAGRLPDGVTPGLWDYVRSANIADDYDNYFAQNRLFQFDQQVLLEQLARYGVPRGSVVADLGCGTGRALLAVADQGYRGLAIDLSSRMLEIVREKAGHGGMVVDCVQVNLVELDCIRDHAVDAAVCLFSTLGMIRGSASRLTTLRHIRRILKPGGPFVLHVHNFWYNFYDPGGPAWVLGSYLRALFDRLWEPGDKYFLDRGVPNMYLHVFTQGEITRALRMAGFRIRQVIPLDSRRHRPLRAPWVFGRLRATGWILVAQ
jgi:ubiquinone/menaquinone biosynthesis C-methylase UbiE